VKGAPGVSEEDKAKVRRMVEWINADDEAETV
jgi:hypothetical protein